MSYRGGRYNSSGNRRGSYNNSNFRNNNNSRRDSSGFRSRSDNNSRSRDNNFDNRRRLGSDDRRRGGDDFKQQRYDNNRRERRDSFGSNSSGNSRGMNRRKFNDRNNDQSPRRRDNFNKFGRDKNDQKDFRRRGLERRNFGGDRRGSQHSNDRNSSSSSSGGQYHRNRSSSGNSDRDKMPPPKNFPRRGGMRDRIGRRSLLGRGNNNDNMRRDTKVSLVHKRLAEKHSRPDRAREVINKRIKMAKLRSAALNRQRVTKLAKLRAIKRAKLTSSSSSTGGNSKSTSAVVRSKKQSESKDKDTADEMWDDDEKQIHEEEMAAKKAEEALHGSSDDATKKKTSTAVTVKKERKESERSEKDTPTKSSESKRVALNLTCVHCKSKCQTPMEYKVHLDGILHQQAMRKISIKQQAILNRMRMEQRNAQKEADESVDKDARSKHCQLCRLFYKQTKEEHQQSEDHQSIRKFLLPYCAVCKISYKGFMAYEIHRSSMLHLRNKANLDKSGKVPDDEEAELDLDNFTTVDEVGEIDGDDENGMLEAQTTENEHESGDEEPSDVNVGAEHIQQVQVSWCELCHQYLSHQTKDPERTLSRHCAMRSHLRNYIRYKDHLVLSAQQRERTEKRKAKREAEEAAKKAKENGNHEQKDEDVTMKEDDGTQKDNSETGNDENLNESSNTDNGDTLDISIKKEKDDSFAAAEEDEGVTA